MSVVVRNVDSTELRISFAGPFSQEQVSKVKKIKGRRWCPTEKYWAVPYSEETLKYLISIFADEEVIFHSFNLTKDSKFTLGCDQRSNSKEVSSGSRDSQDKGIDDQINIVSDKNHGVEGKYLELSGIGIHELLKGTEETKGSLPSISDRTAELQKRRRKPLTSVTGMKAASSSFLRYSSLCLEANNFRHRDEYGNNTRIYPVR